jgi:uncharacterized protein DUF4397
MKGIQYKSAEFPGGQMLGRVTKLGVSMVCMLGSFALVGCGSGGNAQFRVLQASPNEPTLNVLIDGTSINSNLGFAANTGYQTEKSGSHQFAMEASGSTTNLVPSADQTINLGSSTQNTFILDGYSSSISGIMLSDDTTTPANSGISLRIVNAAPSIAGADVFIVASGATLSGSPAISDLTFGSASSYQSLAAGTYTVYFTEPGTTLEYYDTGTVTFTANQNRTIVLLSGPGSLTSVTLADLN